MQGQPSTYTCTVGNPDSFEMDESVTVEASPDWNGIDGEITINFEPLSLGEVRDTLRITSPDGGEFVCMLYGHGIAPLPQGPFLISDGNSHTVEFKNVFNGAQDFVFVCDNSAFEVTPASQKVEALGEREYKLSFTGFKDGEKAETTVTFQNQETGEFVFYEVHASCVAPIVMREIKLKSTIARGGSAAIVAAAYKQFIDLTMRKMAERHLANEKRPDFDRQRMRSMLNRSHVDGDVLYDEIVWCSHSLMFQHLVKENTNFRLLDLKMVKKQKLP